MDSKPEYPKFKYHKNEKPKIVKDRKEEEALGKDWADSPAAFEKEEKPEPKEKPEGKKKTKAQRSFV